MIHIFVTDLNERMKYTFEFIFKERGIRYKLWYNYNEFIHISEPRLNYSNTEIEGVIKIEPSSVLYDSDIGNYAIDKNLFYQESCLSFNGKTDPVASIFYILSRMEEYSSIQRDKWGRFEGKNSVLYRFEWHELAICDRWALDIVYWLKKNEILKPHLKKPTLQFTPTFDIDNAYAYKHKGIWRTILSNSKDFLLGRQKRLIERQKVQTGSYRDPYDTYDQIYALKDIGINFKMFWLLGDFAKFDRNISFRHKRHRRLIQRMRTACEIGIHPSVKSNNYEFFLHNEIERLEKIIDNRVHFARQHYLMLKLPQTYETYLEQEIKDDYTMGFADICGFRLGTAKPIKWFNLRENKQTSLTLHPFAFMDGTLNEYLKISPVEAMGKIAQLYNEVKEFGGEFSFIWHNETIGDYGIWKGWSEVFEFSINIHEHQ